LTIGRSGTITIGDQTFTVTQTGVLPTNLVASAITTTSVGVIWSATSVNHFEVWRNSGAGFTMIASPTTNNYTDNTVLANTTYVYKVRAIDSGANASAYSNNDLATTFFFTDDPLVASSTIIKAGHLTELRQAVNYVRAAAGLGAASFTDSAPMGVVVKAIHITELRTALDPARSGLGVPALVYTSIAAGSVVGQTEFTELRNGVK